MGYSDFLAHVLQQQYEDLATRSDRLTDIDKRVRAWEKNVKSALETTVRFIFS